MKTFPANVFVPLNTSTPLLVVASPLVPEIGPDSVSVPFPGPNVAGAGPIEIARFVLCDPNPGMISPPPFIVMLVPAPSGPGTPLLVTVGTSI